MQGENIMRRIFAATIVVIITVLTLVSCGTAVTSDTDDTTDTTAGTVAAEPVDAEQIVGDYYYKHGLFSSGDFSDGFSISLKDDGTAAYYATVISSYVGFCGYTVEGDIVTLTDGNIPGVNGSLTRVFKFRYEDGKLIYLAGESDKFTYYNPPEGAVFDRVETVLIPG